MVERQGADIHRDRPSMPEIVTGLSIMALVGFGGAIALMRAGLAPGALGLILTAWSGIAGLAGFCAAWLLRRPALRVFGLCPVTGRWLLLGAGAGLAVFLAKGAVVLLATSAAGSSANPQDIYAAGGSGSTGSLVMATLLLGIFTPLGEEFLFRGVVTNGLLRFGTLAGVAGGAVIFALLHGINIVLPAALLLGLVAGELFRRTHSIWPGVVVHVVYNLPTVPIMVWAQMA